eukprot:CAMPEP_0201671980 /NCGR_PEP_ID=MMETSP0494-20130426/31235_1 /ASSEMBLY_ACC=CAM_ASM_000839 /TAXON_ID=420259 /ORGANISM="Thalassiosira gravida, Strain GMp14c1" /LENGTH=883 /DNA_ID=CAMNT_0048153495 /DNA_START=588 /DNA_END=3240 /DNA_ORIENTATION=+
MAAPPESSTASPPAISTVTTDLTSTTTSPTPRPLKPLVNRRSNPIISTEDSADDDDPSEHDCSCSNEMLEEPVVRASGTEDYDAALPTAAATAAATAGKPVVEPNDVTLDKLKAIAGEQVIGYVKADNIENTTIIGEAANFDVGRGVHTASSVEVSMNKTTVANPNNLHLAAVDENSYIPKSMTTPNVSFDSASMSQPKYLPTTLTTNVPIAPTIGSNPGTPSNTPTSYISSKYSSSSSEIDASHHTRKRGSGYLTSKVTLSTPPDVFAAGCTLLQLCAIGNLPSISEYVSSSFNNVNFRDYDRRTALHVASSEGHLAVVKYLVHRGGNVNRSDRWGGSPLDDAHRHRHTDVARYLRSRGARTGSLNLTANLIAAAAAGDIEEVTMICDSNNTGNNRLALDLSGSRKHGAGGGVPSSPGGLDMSTSRGKTALRAAQVTSLDMSEPTATPDDAVDINKGDYDKRTALHLAAGEGHLDVVQFLCKRGADVNVEDRWGGKPLDDALQKGNERVAETLRKYGAKSADDADFHRKSFMTNGTYHNVSTSLSIGADAESENLRVEFSELEMIERIGSGAFGEIYKCRWRGILVASKCIKASKIQREWLLKNRSGMKSEDRIKNRVEAIKQTAITEEDKRLALEDFRKETAILRRLRHPNIVMMLAYSHTEDVEVMISELMRCSLLDIFKANNISNSQIPKRTQIAYAQQLAAGMNHLHKSRPPIIHRDLKPANLLIDFSGHLKIADFGLAKIRPNPEQSETEAFLMTGETGSYRFMAPEVFRHEEYTQTVDVYSYAMIFYYLLRSTPPWSGLSGLDAVTKAAVDGERPLIPRNVDERLSTLLKRCWDEDPRARPSFEEIITCLTIYSHDVFKTNDEEVQILGTDSNVPV